MSVYSRIFATTSKYLTSAAARGQRIPEAAYWAFPGLVGATWFIWGALSDDIKMSVGLYYDPDVVVKRVEAEREARLAAKELLKGATGETKKEEEDDEEEEEEEEEEEVTAQDIEEAVNKAVAASGGDDDDDDDDEEEEEEEEEEKPKKPKVNFAKLSPQEKWDYFAEISTIPGEDDDEDEDDDDDDDDE